MAWGSWEWGDAEVAQVRPDGADWVLRLSAAQVRLADHKEAVWMAVEVRLEGSAPVPEAQPAALLGRVRDGWIHYAGQRLSPHALPTRLNGPVTLELEMALGSALVRLEGRGLQVHLLQSEGVETYQC